jgi:DNA-binding CsgD family transcriptional regulator
MRSEIDMHAYVQDLERHLQLTLFGGEVADPEGAVLLVRGAMADGDQSKAARLAEATQRLARTKRRDADMAVAAEHARGLVEQNPVALEWAAGRYSSGLARACALEDAGIAWAKRGNETDAVARLREAHALYEELGVGDGMARVRSWLRTTGTRIRHWRSGDRPAFGWGSLTDTERTVADLVAQGFSNREVASQMFVSTHTVAFHLRHVFWKLELTSRVQLARLVAEQSTQGTDGKSPAAAPPIAS